MFKKSDIIYVHGDKDRLFKVVQDAVPFKLAKIDAWQCDIEVIKSHLISEPIGRVYCGQIILPEQWATIESRGYNHPLTKIFK